MATTSGRLPLTVQATVHPTRGTPPALESPPTERHRPTRHTHPAKSSPPGPPCAGIIRPDNAARKIEANHASFKSCARMLSAILTPCPLNRPSRASVTTATSWRASSEASSIDMVIATSRLSFPKGRMDTYAATSTPALSRCGGIENGTVNLSNPRAIFAGSPPRFTRSRVTYEAYVVSRTSTRPQVDSAMPRTTTACWRCARSAWPSPTPLMASARTPT